jgi:hypothetical protein
MAADISSIVAEAIGSRNWWDWWGDAAAIAVTAGVILESVTDFKFLAKITGLSTREKLRERIAKFGLGLLIVALVAEVVIGRHVSAATDTIESNLTTGMNRAADANGRLAIKIKAQEHDLNTAKTDLATAQGQIGDLAQKERVLSAKITQDDSRLASMEKEIGEFEEAEKPREFEQFSPSMALKKVPGVPVLIIPVDKEEPRDFAGYLATTINLAKWPVELWAPDGFPTVEGVTVEYRIKIGTMDRNNNDHKAASAICVELTKQNIDAAVVPFVNETSEILKAIPEDALVIRVGPKPNHFFENKWLAKRGASPSPTAQELVEQARQRVLKHGMPPDRFPVYPRCL